jgi:hypothetical protein
MPISSTVAPIIDMMTRLTTLILPTCAASRRRLVHRERAADCFIARANIVARDRIGSVNARMASFACSVATALCRRAAKCAQRLDAARRVTTERGPVFPGSTPECLWRQPSRAERKRSRKGTCAGFNLRRAAPSVGFTLDRLLETFACLPERGGHSSSNRFDLHSTVQANFLRTPSRTILPPAWSAELNPG